MMLVTGSEGQIGRCLCATLRAQAIPFVGVDWHRADGHAGALDIADRGQLEPLFAKQKIAQVIHLASILPTAAKANPAEATRVNVLGSLHLLEFACRYGASRFVFASSNSVYGTPSSPEPVSEESPAAPEDLYGAGKRYVEVLGENSGRACGLSFLALRIPVVVGPGVASSASPWRSQIFDGLDSAEERDIAIPYASGTVLAMAYVEDVARTLTWLATAEHPSFNLYNGYAESIVIDDMKKEVEGLNPRLRVTLGNLKVRGFANHVDSTRIVRETGRPVPLRQRLREWAAAPKTVP
jgi:nucleoside-diphosphate-sugar epimerase